MKFKPYAAWMPSQDTVRAVASLPYDVLTDDEARALASASELSIVRVIRPEVMFSPHQLPPSEEQYRAAAKQLKSLRERGALAPTNAPGYYIYRLERLGHVQTGIVGLASTAEYEANAVRKHELTRPDKELDRTLHMDFTSAQLGLVYLAHHPLPEIDELTQLLSQGPPDLRFELGPVVHEVWLANSPEAVNAIELAFAELDVLYIADGHHRAAAAARVSRMRREREATAPQEEHSYNYFACAAFSSNQLEILPYQRVVKDLAGHTPEAFLDAISERYLVRPAKSAAPESAGHVAMYLAGRWYDLEPLPGVVPHVDPVRSLDVAVLQDALLAPVLGIDDPRRDPRIDFVGGVKPLEYLEKLVDRGQYAAAFSMAPTRMTDVMRVADSGREMPPKSTWFEPKLASGVFVHHIGGSAPNTP